MNLPALVLLYASDVSPFAINRSANEHTNPHTNVRARDYKEKLTALQYYNTIVAILQSERNRGNNSKWQATKARFCRGNQPMK